MSDLSKNISVNNNGLLIISYSVDDMIICGISSWNGELCFYSEINNEDIDDLFN